MATYRNECFPTDVRATASRFCHHPSRFCYHQGAIWGDFVAPVIAYFATSWGLGYGVPMMIGTMIFALSYVCALLIGQETKGKEFVAELQIAWHTGTGPPRAASSAS